MTTRSQEFTTPGVNTFTVPTGVSCVFASGIAGGAGGGTSDSGFSAASGGGGAGEHCSNVLLPVTAGGTLSITVGAGGAHTTGTATNVHDGPLGNTALEAGNGGGDTIIGPIRLRGGFGGLGGTSGIGEHGGKGGGLAMFNSTDIAEPPYTGFLTNAGQAGSGTGAAGFPAFSRAAPRFFGGAGGGAGSNLVTPGNGFAGGACGPYAGGAGGTASANNNAGSGGGASKYGAGAAGGNGGADAGAPVGYGAAGGGAGGGVGGAHSGSSGNDGYVLITWTAP